MLRFQTVRRSWPVLALLFASTGTAGAGGLEIEDAWARASLGAVPNSAAYMTIRSDAPDRLVEASSPGARRVALHNTTMDAGVSKMRPVAAVEVGPGSPAVLEPGGLHLMLMGLAEKLEEGGSLQLELVFEQAGPVTIEVPVRGLTAGHRPGG